jgi:hypothetical protein
LGKVPVAQQAQPLVQPVVVVREGLQDLQRMEEHTAVVAVVVC